MNSHPILRVTATLGHDAIDGGRSGGIRYADRDVPVVVFSGDLGLTVTFNGDSEAELPHGAPAHAAQAIREIAELIQQADVTGWRAQGYDRAPVAWEIDAAGRYEDVEAAPEAVTMRRVGGAQQLAPVAL